MNRLSLACVIGLCAGVAAPAVAQLGGMSGGGGSFGGVSPGGGFGTGGGSSGATFGADSLTNIIRQDPAPPADTFGHDGVLIENMSGDTIDTSATIFNLGGTPASFADVLSAGTTEFQRDLQTIINLTPEAPGPSIAGTRRDLDELLSGRRSLDDFLDQPGTNYEDILRGLMTPPLPGGGIGAVQQTAPGTGQGGTSGTDACRSTACGSGAVVEAGEIADKDADDRPICPGSLCASPEPGCGDAFCGFPAKTPLPFDPATGRSTLTYLKRGFPEVIAAGIFWTDGNRTGRECSATVLHNKWVVTALHCFVNGRLVPIGGGPKDALKAVFDAEASSVAGWSKLTPKAAFPAKILVDSRHQNQRIFASAIHIPYASVDDIGTTQTPPPGAKWRARIPDRDIALLELEDTGLAYAESQLPWLRTDDFAEIDAPISFAGFGWTNADNLSVDDWTERWLSDDWTDLLEAAFNFSTGMRSHSGSDNPLILWRQRTLGGNGGPCRNDSGGPIYAGFNRGHWNDPRMIVGVVSGIYDADRIDGPGDCLNPNALAAGESLDSYANAICQLAENEIRGCKP